MRIRMRWNSGEAIGVLNDTPTAKKLLAALPCTSAANTWGVLLDGKPRFPMGEHQSHQR